MGPLRLLNTLSEWNGGDLELLSLRKSNVGLQSCQVGVCKQKKIAYIEGLPADQKNED